MTETPPRLLVVSNRLPVTAGLVDGEVRLSRSSGGLATGLAQPHARSGGQWIGWPGVVVDKLDGRRAELDRELAALRCVPVHLSQAEVERYYEGYANGVLWPLFHQLLESVPRVTRDWGSYEQVNIRFADAVAAVAREGDLIWIHDYQLMLLPALLRARVPRARIGFFLHIPFPASEVLMTLPQRAEILDGLLGADLVGFHTAASVRHFVASVLRIRGLSSDIDRVQTAERNVRFGVFPMGIDAASYANLSEDPAVQAMSAELHRDGRRTIVGIDRLDYTKGIPRRLLAFEQLLRVHPELREHVTLVQVAVPSRERVPAYRRVRRTVERLVGRINGKFATPRWAPIQYLRRGLAAPEVVALYKLADVMAVTPLRDGMNLVAKEFVAARTDGDGVLVLSELTGAASELAEALPVNPYDIHATAETMHRSLTMGEDERRERMRGLRQRVLFHDVHRWVDDFLTALVEAAAGQAEPHAASGWLLRRALQRARTAPKLILLLDYDGTLVPFQQTPGLATPPPGLLLLLAALAERPRTEVHVISGRGRATLESWLGHLPLGLHAEHGSWSRPHGASEWSRHDGPTVPWKDRVLRLLEEFTARTPGSLIEDKELGLSWHWRAADADFGQRQANELRLHLSEMLSNVPVEVLTGSKVVEVRAHGAHKGRVVTQLVSSMPEGALMVALGDDRTDEDMFAALPADAIAVHVGPEPTQVAIRIAQPADACTWLARLCDR